MTLESRCTRARAESRSSLTSVQAGKGSPCRTLMQISYGRPDSMYRLVLGIHTRIGEFRNLLLPNATMYQEPTNQEPTSVVTGSKSKQTLVLSSQLICPGGCDATIHTQVLITTPTTVKGKKVKKVATVTLPNIQATLVAGESRKINRKFSKSLVGKIAKALAAKGSAVALNTVTFPDRATVNGTKVTKIKLK